MRVAMRFAYCGEAVLEIECGRGIKFYVSKQVARDVRNGGVRTIISARPGDKF